MTRSATLGSQTTALILRMGDLCLSERPARDKEQPLSKVNGARRPAKPRVIQPIWTGPYGQGEVSPTGSRPGGLTRDRAMSRSDGDANLRNIASATARHVGPRRKSAAGELRMLERVLRDSVAVS